MTDISMKIKKEEDLYNKFDSSVVSDDVVKFIVDRINVVDREIVLTVISDDPIDTGRLKEAFAVYKENRQRQLQAERRRNLFRQLRLFLIGLAFIAIWLFIRLKMGGLWPEVLSIIGSFAIWEAASIWLVDNPEIRLKKHLLKQLLEIEIRADKKAAVIGEA